MGFKMTDILPIAGWPNVRQLETNEYATGGLNGNMNEQAKSLAGQNMYARLYAGLPFDSVFTSQVGGFPIGGKAALANGDIVRSTIANNTNDPNVSMAGWFYVGSASTLDKILILDNPKIDKIIQVTQNTRISNLKTLAIAAGGGFDVATGVTLTIDANIEAGHYKIFHGDGDVICSYNSYGQSGGLSNANRPKLTEVKVAWFTGINKATSTSSALDGTDVTALVKKAAKMAQYASLHTSFLSQNLTPCKLIFPPNAATVISGDNVLGSQFKNDIYQNILTAISLGQDYRTVEGFTNNYQLSCYHYEIEGNNSKIFWSPSSDSDHLFDNTTNMANLFWSGVNIVPCGNFKANIVNNVAFLYENPVGTRVAFFNALSQQNLNGFKYDANPTASPVGWGKGTVWKFSGYSMADRLRVNSGLFRDFECVVDNENPEAVEMSFQDTTLVSAVADAKFFKISQYGHAFKLENTTLLMKGQNQKLFENISNGLGNVYSGFAIRDCRLEGNTGLNKTLINADYGTYTVENLNVQLGGTGGQRGSTIVDLSANATASFKNCYLETKFKLALSSDSGSKLFRRSPALIFDNCQFKDSEQTSEKRRLRFEDCLFNGKNYKDSINDFNANPYTPTVNFVNSPTSFSDDFGFTVKYPKYYGNFPAIDDPTKTLLHTDIASTSRKDAINNPVGWNLPPYVFIESLQLTTASYAGSATHLLIQIGEDSDTDKYTLLLNRTTLKPTDTNLAWVNVELLDKIAIAAQTALNSKLRLRVYLADSAGNKIGGTLSSSLTMRYRACNKPSELPSGSITSAVTLTM